MADSVIGKLVYLITGDTSGLHRRLTESERMLRAAGRKMESVGKALTVGVTLPITAIGTALVKSAIDAEETANKFNTAFRDVRQEADATARALQENYGLSRVESQQLLAATGDLLKGFGATGAEALSLSDKVQRLAVDLASYNNVEGGAARASQILTKAMLGEREGLTQLGIKISEAEVQGRLLARGQQDLEGRALLLAKAQATLELATEQSGDAMGDFARTQDSAANQLRILKARFQDAATALGEDLLPLATQLIGWARDAVEQFAALDAEQRQTLIRIAAIAASLGPMLVVAGKLTKAVSSLSIAFKLGSSAMGAYSLAAVGIAAAVAGLVAWNNRIREARERQDELLESTRRLVTVTNDLEKARAEAQVKIMTTALGDQNQVLERNKRSLASANAELARLEEEMAKAAPAAARGLAGSLLAARERVASFEKKVQDGQTRIAELNAGLRENQKAIDAYTEANAKAAATTGTVAAATGEFADNQEDLASQTALVEDMLQRLREAQRELAEEEARNSEKRFEFAMMQLDETTQEIVRVNLEKEEFIKAGIARVDAERWAQGEIGRIRQEEADRERQRQLGNANMVLGGVSTFLSQLSALYSAFSSARMAEIEEDYEARRIAIEKNIADEDERRVALADLDAEFQERRQQAQNEAAKQEKALAVFGAILSTAQAILNALATTKPFFPLGLAMSSLAAATGALQIATIKATPVPSAAGGADFTTFGPQLLAVGDNPGGREHVTVTPESSPNMAGPEGDTIHLTVNLDGKPIADFVTGATRRRQILVDAGAVT